MSSLLSVNTPIISYLLKNTRSPTGIMEQWAIISAPLMEIVALVLLPIAR